MSFIAALGELNSLKRRRIIKDYAVIGAVAATAYMEPVFTEDIDVIVLVDTDQEYRRTFGRIAELAEGQDGMHQVLGGVPVQLFPSTVMPLYRDAVENARQIRIDNLRVKIATAEHLILLYLLANRDRDRLRTRYLLRNVSADRLQELLEKFDDSEKTLTSRLQSIRGTSVPREGEMAPPTGADESSSQT